jgi:hypothetical protein
MSDREKRYGDLLCGATIGVAAVLVLVKIARDYEHPKIKDARRVIQIEQLEQEAKRLREVNK